MACTTGTVERDPTELVNSAQPASHRPTGACQRANIIPPSRLCTIANPLQIVLWRLTHVQTRTGQLGPTGHFAIQLDCLLQRRLSDSPVIWISFWETLGRCVGVMCGGRIDSENPPWHHSAQPPGCAFCHLRPPLEICRLAGPDILIVGQRTKRLCPSKAQGPTAK